MRRFIVAAAVAAAALLSSVSTTEAAFRVKVTSANFGTVEISDAFPASGGGDNSGIEGRISFNIEFGGGALTIVGNAANTKPFQGSAAEPSMSLNWEVTQSTGSLADTITILVSDQTFTPIPLGLEASIGGTIDQPPVSSVTYQVFTSDTNTLYGTDGASSTPLVFNTDGTFEGSTVFNVNAAPYTITQSITVVTTAGAGEASGNANVRAVPVPAGLVLALSALPVLGLGYLRRRKATKAETVA